MVLVLHEARVLACGSFTHKAGAFAYGRIYMRIQFFVK
jgi:hypothetical protein